MTGCHPDILETWQDELACLRNLFQDVISPEISVLHPLRYMELVYAAIVSLWSTPLILATSSFESSSWTDSTIVIQWLDGSPRHFKTYVGNHVSTIINLIPLSRWRHVNGCENPADCGLFLNKSHWNGPTWLGQSSDNWPRQSTLPPNKEANDEEREYSFAMHTHVRAERNSLISKDSGCCVS